MMYALFVSNSNEFLEAICCSETLFEEKYRNRPGKDDFTWKWVTSLEDYQPLRITGIKTSLDILKDLRQLFSNQALPVQYEFRQVMTEVQVAAEAGNIPLMRYVIEQLDLSTTKTLSPTQAEGVRVLCLNCFA
jgi:hypothetical protein